MFEFRVSTRKREDIIVLKTGVVQVWGVIECFCKANDAELAEMCIEKIQVQFALQSVHIDGTDCPINIAWSGGIRGDGRLRVRPVLHFEEQTRFFDSFLCPFEFVFQVHWG